MNICLRLIKILTIPIKYVNSKISKKITKETTKTVIKPVLIMKYLVNGLTSLDMKYKPLDQMI